MLAGIASKQRPRTIAICIVHRGGNEKREEEEQDAHLHSSFLPDGSLSER